MNQELTSSLQADFTVNSATGEAFISQTKLAEKLGIARSSLQKWLTSGGYNYMISEGIPSEIVQQAAVHYAYTSKEKSND